MFIEKKIEKLLDYSVITFMVRKYQVLKYSLI